MRIVWDEPKRLANLAKHGLDFADLNETFSTTHRSCLRITGGGPALARTSAGVIVAVFVSLGKEAISVISMRPASRNERKLYAER